MAVAIGVGMMFGLTVSPQMVNYADATDLVLASLYRGLAHPPGYPLYVRSLHQLIALFPNQNPAWLGGVMAAGLMGVTAGLLIV